MILFLTMIGLPIQTVVQEQRSTDVFDTKNKLYQPAGTAFYLSNHILENAEVSSRYVVQHWVLKTQTITCEIRVLHEIK